MERQTVIMAADLVMQSVQLSFGRLMHMWIPNNHFDDFARLLSVVGNSCDFRMSVKIRVHVHVHVHAYTYIHVICTAIFWELMDE